MVRPSPFPAFEPMPRRSTHQPLLPFALLLAALPAALGGRRPAGADSPGGGTAANLIDVFVNERLAEEHVTPGPPADARTLLRRAYADLLGVPPSPAEAFLNDTSPGAYERLVDRLLADPRYGE